MVHFLRETNGVITLDTFKTGTVEHFITSGRNRSLSIDWHTKNEYELVISCTDYSACDSSHRKFFNILGKPLTDLKITSPGDSCSYIDFSFPKHSTSTHDHVYDFDSFFVINNISYCVTNEFGYSGFGSINIRKSSVEEIADRFIKWKNESSKQIIDEFMRISEHSYRRCYGSHLVNEVYG